MKHKLFPFITLALLLITAFSACQKVPVSGVIIDGDLLLFVDETTALTASILPPNAHNKNVTWESNNLNIATVDKDGKVTGKAIGKAIITVKTEDGGKTAKCFVTVVQPIEPEMIWVEGGTFTMGCTDEQSEDCSDEEKPAHSVTLNSFYIGKYEITQKEWVGIMGSNPCYFTGDDLPVEMVSWNDTQEFIKRLNELTGKNYRLPTEAEWEYVARGGNMSEGYKYSGSDNIDEVGWYNGNSVYSTHQVGTKKANELGIFDMSGNVWEWCSDWYGNYPDTPQNNPTGYSTGTTHVVHGGSYYNRGISVWVRGKAYPTYCSKLTGFRLVLPEN